MYADTKTWNPFAGCRFKCKYCTPSFQAQLKRRKHACTQCYNYIPHTHPERLARIPSAKIIFVAGDGDISFCPPKFTRKIIEQIKKHNKRGPYKTYYLQSKNPAYFEQFLKELPENVALVTTLETNRDEGYDLVSKAPKPSVRYRAFANLNYSNKIVTIEPLMDFDLETFTQWILNLKPRYVWIGFNTKRSRVHLNEPEMNKVVSLIAALESNGIKVKKKNLRR